MEVGIREAKESLRYIEEAQAVAEQNSQNNGVVQLVWGFTILASMIGFDLMPWLTVRLWPEAHSGWLGPLAAAGFMTVVATCASVWMKRYVRDRPVHSARTNNRWLYLRENRRFAGGYWGLWHVAVLCGGIAIAFWIGHLQHKECLPFTFTTIGIIDAAPLLIVGWQALSRRSGKIPV